MTQVYLIDINSISLNFVITIQEYVVLILSMTDPLDSWTHVFHVLIRPISHV